MSESSAVSATPTPAPGDRTPSRWVCVRFRQVAQQSVWQPFRWELASVEGCPSPTDSFAGRTATVFGEDPEGRWAAAICQVTLYPDEAEGYVLNLTTDSPSWFVHFRLDEEAGLAAQPEIRLVTLSYNEAGRLMDASERVEVLPIDQATGHWLATYAERFFVPEPKKRQRPASFRPTTVRGPA